MLVVAVARLCYDTARGRLWTKLKGAGGELVRRGTRYGSIRVHVYVSLHRLLLFFEREVKLPLSFFFLQVKC